jgi:hypothetical protein
VVEFVESLGSWSLLGSLCSLSSVEHKAGGRLVRWAGLPVEPRLSRRGGIESVEPVRTDQIQNRQNIQFETKRT